MTSLDSILKSRDINVANKGPSSHSYGLSSSHVWMWELDHKKGWAPKNWCLQTVVLEKTLASALDCKEMKPVNHKGNRPWIFMRRTDAEGETPILGPPDVKNIWKRPWCWERLKAGEGGGRGWDGWMASLTQWTWTWENFGRRWVTGRPGVLQSMGTQRVGYDWATEQQQQQLSLMLPFTHKNVLVCIEKYLVAL